MRKQIFYILQEQGGRAFHLHYRCHLEEERALCGILKAMFPAKAVFFRHPSNAKWLAGKSSHEQVVVRDVFGFDSSDIFNAATNMQGVVVSAAYNWTDGLTSTVRYAYAMPVNGLLATPNVQQDLQEGDLKQYNLFQADLMWKF